MNVSYKNQLQEYYQKRGKPIPTYAHGSTISGWESTVVICDDRKFQSEGRTKKDADQEVAKMVLDTLLSSEEEKVFLEGDLEFVPYPKPTLKSPGCVLILIDLENSPKVDKEWLNIRWDCCQVEAFAGKLSSYATKNLEDLYPFVDEFHIVDSGYKDAADIAISFRAGRWLENIPYGDPCNFEDAIFIVSRDRFASALVDVLKQSVREMKIQPEVANFINMNDCFDRLIEMSYNN
jgi:hypothetical protein